MKFNNYTEAMQYVAQQEKKMGKMKYRSTPEFHAIYPQLDELYKAAGYKRAKRTRVEIRFCISL